jgi:hypothetical protein
MAKPQSNTHIIAINTSVTEGVAVTSAQFSIEIRTAVAGTAKGLLSELSYKTPGCNTREMLGTTYINIVNTFDCWNTTSTIPASMIRNAIRIMDMRIQHCNNSLKEGSWSKAPSFPCHFVQGITDKTSDSYVCHNTALFNSQYNGNTMELMLATRQILVDSLITITPEFE